MKRKALLVSSFGVFVLLGVAGAAAEAQAVKTSACLKKFGQKEWSIMLKDLNAEMKKKFVDDVEYRKSQVESIRQLLAYACEAEKLGIAKERSIAAELGYIRSEVVALEYDKRLPKGLPFSSITDAQIAAFYRNPSKTSQAEEFLNVKIGLMKQDDPTIAGREIAEEEKNEAKKFFAKVKIAESQAAGLGEPFRSTTELKVRLQQAQFLARRTAALLATKITVTDADVTKYIAAHPELDPSAKRARAVKLLDRAKAGEDFAKFCRRVYGRSRK